MYNNGKKQNLWWKIIKTKFFVVISDKRLADNIKNIFFRNICTCTLIKTDCYQLIHKQLDHTTNILTLIMVINIYHSEGSFIIKMEQMIIISKDLGHI